MALGSGASCFHGAPVCQQRDIRRPLPADLRRGRAFAVPFIPVIAKKPVKVFFYSALVCGVLEYVSGMFLEYKWGLRWWDYSGHFLNIHGRVCLLGTVAFGMGGTLLICLVLPWYGKIYGKIPEKWRNLLWVALTLLFVADGAWCAMHPNMGSGIAY